LESSSDKTEVTIHEEGDQEEQDKKREKKRRRKCLWRGRKIFFLFPMSISKKKQDKGSKEKSERDAVTQNSWEQNFHTARYEGKKEKDEEYVLKEGES
jgi:hypothetical protein